ncbi:hypothetical protein V6K52_14125 [Knoellia sp. S7-12]|uniref:hypothetical protein n=1 Tax=Knoellia sp. S7-12 TaxID=3126698 RepID=UPI0033689F11
MTSEPPAGKDWRGNGWLTAVLPTVIWLVVLWLVGTSQVGSLTVFFVLFFGFVAGMFLVPFTYHVVRAVRARNPWLPFERQPWGRYTFMANHRWQTPFRAPPEDSRTTVGLVFRYVIWIGAIAAVAYPLTLPLHL